MQAFVALREPYNEYYQKLNVKCVANKSNSVKFGIVSTLFNRNGGSFGSEEEVQRDLDKVKNVLRSWVFKKAKTTLGQIRRDNPVLGLIPGGYWDSFDVPRWCVGWGDTASKQRATVAAALGWGFFTDELLLQVVDPVLHQPTPARWLLHVVRDLKEMRGETTWWTDNDYALAMPDPMQPPVSSPSIHSEQAPEEVPESLPDLDVSPPGPVYSGAPPSPGRPSPGRPSPGPLSPPDLPSPSPRTPAVLAPSQQPRLVGSQSMAPRSAPSRTPGQGGSQSDRPAEASAVSQAPGPPGPPTAPSSQTRLSAKAAGKQKASIEDPPAPKDPAAPADPEEPAPGPTSQGEESDAPTEYEDGTVDLRAVNQGFQLPHIFRSATQSFKLFHNLDNRWAAFREPDAVSTRDDAGLIERLKSSEGTQVDLITLVSEERERLRASMIVFGEACVDAPYGSDVAEFALSGVMASLKVSADVCVGSLADRPSL